MTWEWVLGLPAVAWLWLLLGRGGFWRANIRLSDRPSAQGAWPAVVALVPARDEAASVGPCIASLLHQDYLGPLSVVLIDDGSRDGTAEVAAAAALGAPRPLAVLQGAPLAGGWSGKLWALQQGVAHTRPVPEWWLLTDADIQHPVDHLARLVSLGEGRGHDLVSVLARLDVGSAAAHLLIPAFDFFFQKLYPFSWVGDRRRRTAAAAGGCLLVRAAALARAGGLDAVKGALIDDCAIAARVKGAGGSLWLGLGDDVLSLRRYPGVGEVWSMVARTAYTQLDRSPLRLAGTVVGMACLYLLAPLGLAAGLVAGNVTAAGLGALGVMLMTVAYLPSVRRHRLAPFWAFTLPMAAALYTLMTLDSARRHHWRDGANWKGRRYPG